MENGGRGVPRPHTGRGTYGDGGDGDNMSSYAVIVIIAFITIIIIIIIISLFSSIIHSNCTDDAGSLKATRK